MREDLHRESRLQLISRPSLLPVSWVTRSNYNETNYLIYFPPSFGITLKPNYEPSFSTGVEPLELGIIVDVDTLLGCINDSVCKIDEYQMRSLKSQILSMEVLRSNSNGEWTNGILREELNPSEFQKGYSRVSLRNS